MPNKIIYSPGDEIKNGIKFVREGGNRIQPNGQIKRLVVAICPRCGSEFTAILGNITHTARAGCFKCGRVICGEKTRTHGKRNTVEFGVWSTAVKRCSNPNCKSYPRYGGRGITVCERWRGRDGFANFLSDMGPRPGAGFSIDRINNNGPYSPENCQWADAKTQTRNKRNNVQITYNGRTQILADWATEVGISAVRIARRIKELGWSIEDALTIKPVLGRNGH